MRFLERLLEFVLGALLDMGKANYRKAILACSTLVLSTLISTQARGSTLYARVLSGGIGVDGTRFFSSSHHFVMSLDMVVMLCMMILIAFHTLKIAETSSVR